MKSARASTLARSRRPDRQSHPSSSPPANPLLSYPVAAILLFFAGTAIISAPSDGHAASQLLPRENVLHAASAGIENLGEDGGLDPRFSTSPIPFQLASLPRDRGRRNQTDSYEMRTPRGGIVVDEFRFEAGRAGVRSRIVELALQYMGTPYKWGGASPSGFDCSGFVQYVYALEGIAVQRPARVMLGNVPAIDRSNLLPGDLVFFRNTDHVGIYIGDNRFIHASSGAGRVTITDLDASYYNKRYVGSGRAIS